MQAVGATRLQPLAEAAALETEIASLERMTLRRLRSYWQVRWGYAPQLRSAVLLRHMIAWRLQAAIYGGLDAPTKGRIQRKTVPVRCAPPAGSKLTREYRGVLHEVEVGEGTFTYAGAPYRSLSAVASAITGTGAVRLRSTCLR